MIYSVEYCISHVQFNSHTLLLYFHAGVYNFLNNNNIVKYMTPRYKTPCEFVMRWPMMLYILVVKIFDRILYELLHNEIGLNISSDRGIFFFGVKARKDDLVAPPILSFFVVQFSIFFRSSFIISHVVL